MVSEAWTYPWSSARWLVGEEEIDPLVKESPLFQELDDWRTLLSTDPEESRDIRLNTRTGRPVGGRYFVESVERLTGRSLRPQKTGRKAKK
jgi:hypothetical protein